MADKKLHIILDLDETLIQHANPQKLLNDLNEKEKNKYIISDSDSSGLFLIRPHLDTFLKFLFENKRCDVSIWTWSDDKYAKDIATLVTHGKPELFTHIWSSKDTKVATKKYGHSKCISGVMMEIIKSPKF